MQRNKKRPEIKKCPACESFESEIYLTGVQDYTFRTTDEGWDIKKCLYCSSLYLKNPPTKQEIHNYYKNYYTKKEKITIKYKVKNAAKKTLNIIRYKYNINIIVKLINTISKQPKWIQLLEKNEYKNSLDYGCGSGIQSEHLTHIVKNRYGYEIDRSAAGIANERGLKMISEIEFKRLAGEFNLVIMIDTIEHIIGLNEDFLEIVKLIPKNGNILITTPNSEAESLQLEKEAWRGLEVPRHIQIFSIKGICIFLERNGFEIMGLRTATLNEIKRGGDTIQLIGKKI